MATNIMNQKTIMASEESQNDQKARLLNFVPVALCLIAAALLLASIAFPYWGMVLQAPQYPGGLQMRVFVNHMTGDEDPALDEVSEIDGLNHYIGMKSLYDAARLERSIAIPAIVIMSILLVAGAFWKSRYAWLLVLPAMGFPFVFLADLAFWMNHYGQNLDPYAPLSSAIHPFTPPILGEGIIGQFSTVAYVDTGWYMAVGATVLIAIAMLLRLWVGPSHNAEES